MKYLFEWTPAISVGDKIIDTQHQKLLGEVNTLLSYIVAERDDQMISDAVAFLDRYISDHLSYEEKYMEEHNYPDIEAHKKLHKDFIEHYKFFHKQLDAGVSRETLATEIEQYIGNWWLDHIGKEDHKYAIYIASQEQK
jgi:hemerythrin-like metal-binding protein